MTEVDRATALTPLAIMVLSLLQERPMHPYEMFQTLIARGEQRLANVRPGSLYHTVDRLRQRELVRVNDIERSGNRPERTVYAITDAGTRQAGAALAEMLARPAAEYPQIHLALAEAHELPADRVVALLDQRLIALRDQMSDLEGMIGRAARSGVAEVYHLDAGLHVSVLRTQIDWLHRLARRIESGELHWPTGPGCAMADAARTETIDLTDTTTRTETTDVYRPRHDETRRHDENRRHAPTPAQEEIPQS